MAPGILARLLSPMRRSSPLALSRNHDMFGDCAGFGHGPYAGRKREMCKSMEIGDYSLCDIQRLSKKPSFAVYVSDITMESPSSASSAFYISALPNELALRIFEFLAPAEVNRVLDQPISREWHMYQFEQDMWRLLCRHSWGVPDGFQMRHMHSSPVAVSNGQLQSVDGSISISAAPVHDEGILLPWRFVHKRLVAVESQLRRSKDHQFVITTAQEYFAVPEFMHIFAASIASLALQEETRMKICQADGVALLLRAMGVHSRNSKLQEEACRALVVLGRPMGGAEGKAFTGREDALTNVLHIGQHGGLQLVLEAMRNHPTSAAVQANGCWALVNLALITQHKLMIVEHGGVQLILNAMQHHPTDPEVQYRACFVLVNLAIPESNKGLIVGSGGIDLIVGAMKRHQNHSALLHRACLVLRNLSFKHDARPLMRAAGAIDAIKTAIAAHPKDELLNIAGFNALQKIQPVASID